jgi:hypothetical protein
MVKPVDMPADNQGLRQMLHDKIEHLNTVDLSVLGQVALRLEAEHAAAALDQAFDDDRKAGKLDPQRVQKILTEVRKDLPYR